MWDIIILIHMSIYNICVYKLKRGLSSINPVYIQVLVDAVEDRAGGNHKVLAKKIANSPLG